MSEIAQEADVSRHDKIGASDPNRTWRTTSIGVAALLVRLTCLASSIIFLVHDAQCGRRRRSSASLTSSWMISRAGATRLTAPTDWPA
jgi:hypothetical protein